MNALAEPTTASRQFRDRLAGDDLRELVPHADVVIDAGAGAGGFAKQARVIWPDAQIISFEPADRFNKTLRVMDGQHNVWRVALGNYDGEAKLYLTHGAESNSLLTFLPNGPLSKVHAVIGGETVPVKRLDSVVKSRVDVLKMDVQGAELLVLDGATETLKHKPVIYAEVAFQQQYEGQPLLEDVDAYLAERGYRRLYLYASPMPDIWGDAIYVPDGGTSEPIRLNIGAGDTVIPGFTAIDRKFGSEAYPLNYADGSVEEIRCVHMLEHLSYREVPEALKEWHRVLKPGGRIRISVPDVDKVLTLTESDPNWAYYLMGGQTDENDFHKSAYDGARLGGYLENAGFEGIRTWASANTDLAASDISLNLEAIKKRAEVVVPSVSPESLTIRVRAICGMPRIGWNDAWMSFSDALKPLGIPIETFQGCFWGQNVQKAMERALRDGIDWLLTLDYDSMIMPQHVSKLMEWLGRRPNIDAIAALQMRRGSETPLFSMKGKTQAEMSPEPVQVDTAHFGLTLIRVECLKTLPKPWLHAVPDENGEWGDNRRDDDITFWDKWKAAGKTVFVAPDVRIGHLELMVSEYDENFQPRHFHVGDWWNRHAKAGHCMRSKKED